MEMIPEDALVEIFRRLPKKSRSRCRFVSKDWSNLLLKNPSSSYSRRLPQWGFALETIGDESLIFCRLDEQGRLTLDASPVFSFHHSHRRPEVIGSCNGLLFSYAVENDGGRELKIRYAVENPATEEGVVLPLHPILEPNSRYEPAGLGLILDQSSSSSFGTSHWKLIALFQNSLLDCRCIASGLKASIFDSAIGVWTTGSARFTRDSDPGFVSSIAGSFFRLDASSIYIDRALHWIWEQRLVILYVKIRTFRLIKQPETLSVDDGVLWESDTGRLNYCNVCKRQGLCI